MRFQSTTMQLQEDITAEGLANTDVTSQFEHPHVSWDAMLTQYFCSQCSR